MLSLPTRIIIAIGGLLTAIYFLMGGKWMVAILFFTVPLFQILGFFMNGTVFLALRKLGKNDFVGAEEVLRKTKYPQYLAKTQKAYYYLAAGLIEARKNNFQIAAPHLEEAFSVGLRTKHDRALAALNLAGIYFNMGNREKSAHYLEVTKNNDPAPVLNPRIEELENALKRTGY